MSKAIDLIVLTRDRSPLTPAVEQGIRSQDGVRLNVHTVIGTRKKSDANRWQTIVRARNRGKQLGHTPWVMFLDDDVVLESDCVATLLGQLKASDAYGALASNYLGEALTNAEPVHVGMGATLFRRRALDQFRFRWTDDRCECQCCCDDLRRQMIGITYEPNARSRHLEKQGAKEHLSLNRPPRSNPTRKRHAAKGRQAGRVLTALDRYHFETFREQFLPSLRAAGNNERVTVVAYGLSVHQQQTLARLKRVDYIGRPPAGIPPARRRIHDFQDVLSEFDESCPTAYWDAGDCIFQTELAPLWKLVAKNKKKLLVCGEGANHPVDGAIRNWTRTIRNPQNRSYVFQLFANNTWLNGGFAAGTAGQMLRYFRAAAKLRESEMLAGSTNPGDQTAMNLYCHSHPKRWKEIDSRWNFCLYHRQQGDYRVRSDGLIETCDGKLVHIVHGNGESLPTVAGFQRVQRRIFQLPLDSPPRQPAVKRSPARPKQDSRKRPAKSRRSPKCKDAKIFGIGLSKTGTKSLHAALVLLGYPSLHYVQREEWLRGDFNTDGLKAVDAVCDAPVPAYFTDLDQRYPGSKFINTVRPDLDDWLRSCERHFCREGNYRLRDEIRIAQYGICGFNRKKFAEVYEQHEAKVREYFRDRPDDLLELDLFQGDGWEQLASFLDKPVPKLPFPRFRTSIGRLSFVPRGDVDQLRRKMRRLVLAT